MKRLFSFILSLVLCTVALASATNRKVVKATSTTVEQVTHYYPYGGVIGDISTQEDRQKYKFEGKELDRSFGLDHYDIHARNYFAMLPMWDRVDPLAEKYYGISPYVYCGGDPVNQGDYDGKFVIDNDDSRKLKSAMIVTPVGKEIWNKMENTKYPITIMILEGTYKKNHPDGKSGDMNPLAITNVKYTERNDLDGKKKKEITEVSIEFFIDSMDDVYSTVQGSDTEFNNDKDPRSRYTKNMKDRKRLTKDDVLGATGSHEGTHATDKKSNVIGESDKNKREEYPIKQEIEFIRQLGK